MRFVQELRFLACSCAGPIDSSTDDEFCAMQVVLLAGGDDKRLHPLTGPAGAVKALLPVANKPLISYPLKALADAGLKQVFLVRVASGGGRDCQITGVP